MSDEEEEEEEPRCPSDESGGEWEGDKQSRSKVERRVTSNKKMPGVKQT
jgi:hypothetical protein